MEYTIDVKGKSLGRAASEVAAILRGKNTPGFTSNKAPDVKVEILNVADIKISGNKMDQRDYKSFSGYPGGLKLTKMKEVVKKKGNEFIFKKAVLGMLPKNKLQSIMIKNLIIK